MTSHLHTTAASIGRPFGRVQTEPNFVCRPRPISLHTARGFVAAFLVLTSTSAFAANKTWNNLGTDFNNSLSWTGGVPGSSDVAVFNSAKVVNRNLSASDTI